MSFDKIAATYVYCMNNHTGQFSREYRLLSRIVRQYKLRLTDRAICDIETYWPTTSNEWPEANRLYRQLVARYCSDSRVREFANAK